MLTRTLPDRIWPGRGTAELIMGSAGERSLLKAVRVATNSPLPTYTFLHMSSIKIDECCSKLKPRSCLLSGFTTLVKLPPVVKTQVVSVEIHADYKSDKSEIIEQKLVELLQENPENKLDINDCDVVICMACWEPDKDRLKRQIDSIRAQTHKSWHCIINDDASSERTWSQYQAVIGDDPRFSLYRNETNLGFYRNFEVALSRVPENVQFISLSDQDDNWYPEKLAVCLAEFKANTTLVYCDMRIVDENSKEISNTYWSGRKNNYTDADVLFLANTVTGAASIFRRNLLHDILPFPQAVGQVFHDHWIACVARCSGKLGYVDKVLYDYHQYGDSVIGRCDFEARGIGRRMKDATANIKHAGKLLRLKSWLLHKRVTALNVFHHEYLRLYLFAEILKMRVPDMQDDAERSLRMFSADWSAVFHLLRAHARIVLKRETTDDAEVRLAAAVFIFKLDRLYGLLFAKRILKRHCQSVNAAEETNTE